MRWLPLLFLAACAAVPEIIPQPAEDARVYAISPAYGTAEQATILRACDTWRSAMPGLKYTLRCEVRDTLPGDHAFIQPVTIEAMNTKWGGHYSGFTYAGTPNHIDTAPPARADWFYRMMLHEIGHSLGLHHIDSEGCNVMTAEACSYTFTEEDIQECKNVGACANVN